MGHKIVYEGRTFPADKIKGGNLYLAASLLASALEVNSFLPVVECDDSAILDFQRNAKLLYYAEPDRPMVFRVQNIKRAGPELYEISATSTLGLLTEGLHYGGIYTGQKAEEVILDICGTVPVEIKHALKKIKLYGWLPVTTPRNNLAQVLFAIGAALKTDLDGVLRIEGLWDGISGTVPRDNMYTDANVDYSARITQVIVTEHQYVPWTEEKQLFEGTAQAGDIITFDEPMHDLVAQGFTILASGANWAKVSAGSGTLTGKTYLHNTRQVSKNVQTAGTPNVKTVEDATLVSLVNSQAVADRLADYYRCRELIDAPVVYRGETPGDRLATWHPFDRTGVDACLESADITLSNTLKVQEKLLVGYVPPQFEQVSVFDNRELLTGSGDFLVPDGVASLTVVLIGGGGGGHKGADGGSSGYSGFGGNPVGKGNTVTLGTAVGATASGSVSANNSLNGSSAGKGGAGGAPGTPGKVLQVVMEVSSGESIHYSCGYAGTSGSSGGATVFGDKSSDSGSVSQTGYYDVVTGETFAKQGSSGESGGDGGSTGSQGESRGGASGGYGIQSNSATQRDRTARRQFAGYSGEFTGGASGNTGGAGGGGAGGSSGAANGTAGSSAYGSLGFYSFEVTAVGVDCGVSGPIAGKGGNGAAGAPGNTYGSAGNGGGGGGGGGAQGNLSINVKGNGTYTRTTASTRTTEINMTADAFITRPGSAGAGGTGGNGGSGKEGCIILYYGQVKKAPAGQLVDKNNKMVLDRLGRRIIM